MERASDVLDVSRPVERRSFLQALKTLLGAVGIALLFPLTILALGLPVVMAVRGLAQAARWMLASIR